ncbi:MAG: PASTA domain-containing protein [Elusimicrobiota bacterium]|nr:PASTA domain-containing protein [Elusimicrobiota bacterium]
MGLKEYLRSQTLINRKLRIRSGRILHRVHVELTGSLLLILIAIWAIHSKKEIRVPNITGKSMAEAKQILSKARLVLRIAGYKYDESVHKDIVLYQTPDAGMSVREGRIVKVLFSKGCELVAAPNLSGLPLRSAKLLLSKHQLLLGEVSESYSLKATTGTILTQNPPTDQSVPKNTLVKVAISAGIPPPGIVLMPDFRQKEKDEAEQWASENSAQINIAEDPGSALPGGTIIDQQPDADSVLSADSEIIITVSSNKSVSDYDRVFQVHHELAESGAPQHIRMEVHGQHGSREIFNGLRNPGAKIDVSIPYAGEAKVLIFANGILVEERELK